MGKRNANAQNQQEEKPLLFISHKHKDTQIADKVATFVRNVTGGGVDVFLSSNPKFEGPRVGKELNAELKSALWRAGVVILVYTSQDEDWSWCMWECGLAEDRDSPATKVVVLQCLEDKPQVFAGTVRVLAWDQESIQALANRFLDPNFFPGLGRSTTGLKESELVAPAKTLHSELAEAIPKKPPENWAAWPFLRLQLARQAIDEVMSVPPPERVAKTKEMLLKHGLVLESSSGLAQLFGRAELPRRTVFGELVDEWSEQQSGRVTDWLDVLARQIVDGSKKQMPGVDRWAHFLHHDGDVDYATVVGRIKSEAASMQFDVYFVEMAKATGVKARMTRIDKMYHLNFASKSAQEVNLQELLRSLEENRWNRIPILDGEHAKYIVHVSMIDRFLRKRVWSGQAINVLTLADLLADKAMEEMFAGTWDVVPKDATLSDARALMARRDNCEDLFVTQGGGRDEPVLGWLTDRDINDTPGEGGQG